MKLPKIKNLSLPKSLQSNLDLIGVSSLIFLSISSFVHFTQLNLVLAYNDSMSHLNLTRLIIDNQEPGISQLGGVWLPLNHVLPLIFIWNDYAWQSGLAGSSFSMISYILSGILIYKIIQLLTGNKLASYIGGLAFALNLNILYLQSTPLTEALYVLFFTASVFFSIKWILTHNEKYLPIIGFCGFLQVLTRYDGWFVTFLQLLILFAFEFIYNKKTFAESFSKMLLVSVPIGFGIGLWLLWNLLIFNDPLFFATGPYSAKAQQDVINGTSSLITKGDLAMSIKAYYFAVIHNVGFFIMTLSIFGSLVLLFLKNNLKTLGVKFLVFLLFLSPFIFNVLALFLGFSILNIPELNWNPSNSPSGYWFNVRYGILALPAIAFFIGMLAARKSYLAFLLGVVIIAQSVFTFNDGIITVVDGTMGASAFRKQDIATFLQDNINETDTVLLSIGFNNPIAFKLGIPLKNVVHEGVSKKWSNALNSPEKYASWIVVSNSPNGDPLYEALIKNQNPNLKNFYDLKYQGKEAFIYKRKPGLTAAVGRENK